MTQTIDPRMTKARAAMLQRHPFWGALALYLKLVEQPGLGTMGTDGTYLAYDPEFLDKITEREIEGVIAHEVTHCAYKHHTRRGNRHHQLWNEACDYAVNRDLLRANFSLPVPHLNDPRFDGMSADEIYSTLKREQEKQQGQSSGQGFGQGQSGSPQKGEKGQGQAQGPTSPGATPQGHENGAGGKPRPKITGPSAWGQVWDAAPEHQQVYKAACEADWDVRIKQAAAAVSARQAGDLPDTIRRMLEAASKPQIDWRAILRRFIDEKVRTDYSWSRPNKRYLGYGYIIPGVVPDGLNQIGVVVDTSGSIDRKALSQFASEIQGAVDEGMTQRVTVIYCDAAVHNKQEFGPGDTVKLDPHGGGGTRFSPAMDWFAKHEPDVSALIYFTDLECNDFGNEPWVPLLWIAYGQANRIRDLGAKVPFGEVVHLTD